MKKRMKAGRLLSIALAALMLALAACSLQGPDANTPLPTQSQAPTPAQPTSAPTEDPTEAPTEAPTAVPTAAPTETPTEEPTEAPSAEPELEEGYVKLSFVNGLGVELDELRVLLDHFGEGCEYEEFRLEAPGESAELILNEYRLNTGRYSITASASAYGADGKTHTVKFVIPQAAYKKGDVIELKSDGGAPLASVTGKGSRAFELPVISYEYDENAVLEPSAELLHPVIATEGEQVDHTDLGLDDWRIFRTAFSVVTLDESEAERYPALAGALKLRNGRLADELGRVFEEMLARVNECRTQEQGCTVSSVRRADRAVLSLIGYEYAEHCDIELNTVFSIERYVCENYDTESGKLLSIADVVTDTAALASILNAELEANGQTMFRFNASEHFSAPLAPFASTSAFAWTLDHDGLFFIINADFSASGAFSLFVPFSENEGLVKQKYTVTSENHMFSFVNGVENWFSVGGRIEKLSEYSKHFDLDETMCSEHGAAFIHAFGRDFILVDGVEYVRGYTESMLLFGNGYACSLFSAPDYGVAFNTDPACIRAGETVFAIGYRNAEATYAIDGDGRIVRLDEYFEVDSEITILRDYDTTEIDFDGNRIGTLTLSEGQRIRLFRINHGFADARTEDGRMVRIELADENGRIDYEEVMAVFGNVDLGP